MERKHFDKARWVQLGLLSTMVAAVVFLTVMIFRMQAQLEIMGQGTQQNAAELSPPASAKPKTESSDSKSATSDEDWFSQAFDPGSWNPFTEMQRIQDHFDKVFNDSFSRFGRSRFSDLVHEPAFSPDLDVQEKDDSFVIRLDLPGVKEGGVDVKVDGKEIRISGERDDVVTNKDSAGHVVRQERRTGSFSRTIDLPEAVDPDKITAKNENGVFTIILPKA